MMSESERRYDNLMKLVRMVQEETDYPEDICITAVSNLLPWMKNGKFPEEMWTDALNGRTDNDIFVMKTMRIMTDHPELTGAFERRNAG